jgi:hypothetical protein
MRRDVAVRLVTVALSEEVVRPARGAAMAPQFAGEPRPMLRATLRPVRQKPAAARSDLSRDLGEAG